MRFAPIIIIETLYCRSYKSHAPRIRPIAAIISPTFGNMLINVSIMAGVTATADSVIDTVKLCEKVTINMVTNGEIKHTAIHTNPILLNIVSDFQNEFWCD